MLRFLKKNVHKGLLRSSPNSQHFLKLKSFFSKKLFAKKFHDEFFCKRAQLDQRSVSR